MASKIYTKTIDASVQGGTDNCLILDPQAAYRVPFSFGDDWTEVTVGTFWSFTFSPTDDNINETSSTARHYSGGSSADTWSYFGVCRNIDGVNYLPNVNNKSENNNMCYAGYIWSQIYYTYSSNNYADRSRFYSNSLGDISNQGVNNVVWHNSAEAFTKDDISKNYSPSSYVYNPFYHSHEATGFAGYLGFKFRKLPAENGFKRFGITRFAYDGNDATRRITDVTMTNLKTHMNRENYALAVETVFDWGTVEEDLPYPDSVLIYNASQSCRPRIHTLAIKRISNVAQ